MANRYLSAIIMLLVVFFGFGAQVAHGFTKPSGVPEVCAIKDMEDCPHHNVCPIESKGEEGKQSENLSSHRESGDGGELLLCEIKCASVDAASMFSFESFETVYLTGTGNLEIRDNSESRFKSATPLNLSSVPSPVERPPQSL